MIIAVLASTFYEDIESLRITYMVTTNVKILYKHLLFLVLVTTIKVS